MNSFPKNLALAAAFIAGAAPALAQAQSSVTLYGRVVAGVEHVDTIADPATGTTGSLTQAAANQWGTSMLGFKGTEDLGGGLKALFLLESGFSSTTGATNGSAFFNRRSYVGLSSDAWGTLQLGKNLLDSNDVWYLDPTGQQFMSSATLVRGRSWQGVDNVIEYTTPTWGGFGLNVQLGLGGQPGNSKALSSQGLSAVYNNGDGLELRAIYTSRYDANGLYSDVYAYSKEGILGGTYRIGAAKLFAAYDNISASASAAGAPTTLHHGWLGVNYDVGPVTLIGAAYHVNANNDNGSATLLVLGANYYLSKRTFLYASLGGVSNSGAANYAADVTVNGPGAGNSQHAVYAGFGTSF